MQRYETTIQTALALFALGVGTALCWPEISPGRPLTDSDLAKVHGLNPWSRSNSIYPVGCEAFQIIPNEQTLQQCKQFGGPQSCFVCADGIATYTGVQGGTSGFNQFDDGQYQCHGQISTAPCTGAAGSGQCGTYAAVQGAFCNMLITDWDNQ